MANTPQPHSKLVVTSGYLCYGALHNIVHGASAQLQGFPTPRPQTSGTVTVHKLEYNVPAKMGTWNAYQLIWTRTGAVNAWFVCHSDVDPEAEVDKILRVSGSPYEPDSGSSRNNSTTEAEGVLVINRYDWGWYNKCGSEEDELDGWPNCVGLADYESAKEDVDAWRDQPSHERSARPGALWLHVPNAEYMFGRFGFDDEHKEARSFIFFTTDTDFTGTSFAGVDKTLRKFETNEERFERRLREGVDFEGLDDLADLHQQAASFPGFEEKVPPESERMGPFEGHEPILLIDDLNAILASRDSRSFAEPWEGKICTLLNEMMMSYLAQFIVPTASFATVRDAASSVFPNRSRETTVDHYLHRFWINPWSQSDAVRDLNAQGLEERVKRFLVTYCGEEGLITDGRYTAGVARGISWLLGEILQLSSNCAVAFFQPKIVPADIRLAVHSDNEILTLVGSSRVFWSGEAQGQ